MERYQRIYYPIVKKFICLGCGKRVHKQKKFWQSINPFNKKPDGTLKDQEYIAWELKLLAHQWKFKHERCSKCRINGRILAKLKKMKINNSMNSSNCTETT